MTDWRPIETAPKGGEGVLLFIPHYPGEVHAGFWSEKRNEWCLWGMSSVSFDFDDDDEDDRPTHWMPLPETPND